MTDLKCRPDRNQIYCMSRLPASDLKEKKTGLNQIENRVL